MKGQKKPLYRKVNTRAHRVHHWMGGDYSDSRNARQETRDQITGTMHGRKRRGLDYTPLFRFLMSKVGQRWDAIYSEAVARQDKPDPIFWLVALQEKDRKEIVGLGESTYFSGMYIDDDGFLKLVNPALSAESMVPRCRCCTHTFNGEPFGRAYPE